MRKFVFISAIYIFIGIVYLAFGEFFLWRMKETYSIEKVTDIQSSSEYELYFGRTLFGNTLSTYKYAMFVKTQPKVLVLGQSVTLQFRDFMFSPFEDDFYNTGLMVRNQKDLEYVLDLFESGAIKKPELVLLGMDFSFVLKNTFLDKQKWIENRPPDRVLSAKAHFKAMQKVYLNARTRRKPETDWGFGRAGMVGRGYRNDGTYRHKPEIERYVQDSTYYDGELRFKLKRRSAPFEVPFEFDEFKAQKIFKLLQRFEENDIKLLLYIPPYSDTFFDIAQEDEMFTSLWKDYMSFQDNLITKGYEVIPFTTPRAIGLKDDYMVDAEHPGEVFCAMQLRDYLEKRSKDGSLLDSLDLNYLKPLFQSSSTLPISFLNDSIDFELRQKMLKRGT